MKDRLGVPREASAGFTMVELLVVVALLVVLVSLAAPSVRELLAVQRLQAIHAGLVTDLQFIRSEAVRRRESLIFEVDGDATMSCYMLRNSAFGAGGCSCLLPPGSACTGAFKEIRTVQIPRANSVALAASSSQGTVATFERDTGYSSPGDLRIDLSTEPRGQMRVIIGSTGRITSCSPDGSVKQVAKC